MRKSRGVRWFLFLGLGLILLFVVGLLLYGRSAGPTTPSPGTVPTGFGTTARQALAPAAELAAQWRDDAQLAVVSRHWPEAGAHLTGGSEWAFQFFSPSTQRLALITVADDGARMTRESLSPYLLPTFSVEEWQVDSDQALQVWWERGGSTLLAHRPEADLAIQLRAPEGGGRHPIWTVAGFAGTDSVITVAVDGTNGAVVEQ